MLTQTQKKRLLWLLDEIKVSDSFRSLRIAGIITKIMNPVKIKRARNVLRNL